MINLQHRERHELVAPYSFEGRVTITLNSSMHATQTGDRQAWPGPARQRMARPR